MIQDTDELITKLSKKLKETENIDMPKWGLFAKTGSHKERLPENSDWWYVRSASIMRKMYINSSPVGVNRLRIVYGGKKDRGHKPSRFRKGSGSIIRKIFQQLEVAGFIKKADSEKKGRVITDKGRSFIDKIR